MLPPVIVVPLSVLVKTPVVKVAVVPLVVVPVKEVNVPVVAANELAVALVTTFKPVSVALSPSALSAAHSRTPPVEAFKT